ncbi:hypothetical protein M758_3G013100 [Ceratodon purpureus]|nr:hypothetical protein M758_3G013100 [Ceratodon purpureus]
MVWCSYCGKDQVAERDDINGFTCCTGCGRVLADDAYSTEVTFSKGADGTSQAEGNFIRNGQSSSLRIAGAQGRMLGFQSDSHEKTLNKGKHEIQEIAERLSIRPREDIVQAAHRFYTIAVERNFTRGRPTPRVAGACLYIVCRQENKPYMLIDFSDSLQTNVYVLGAVFLQLCQLLRLEQHPIMQRPVDPSLFIHRFADRLQFGKKMHAVANSALRLVASMKRDWMQTGRRPSGVCGAALFIAAHIHGFERSKADVVSVVHICEATLKKRLVEFEQTESGSLTAEEFDTKAKEIDVQIRIGLVSPQIEGKGTSEIMCEHKDMGAVHFQHGLCRGCYDEFVKVSGGMQGGSHPPAFKRAEKKRLEEAKKKEAAEKGLVLWEGNDDPTAIKTYQRGQRGRGRGGGPDTGREVVVRESSDNRGTAALPSSQRKIKLKEMARGGVEGSGVKQDSPDKKRDSTEDINDVAADIAALIDVAVPVLEKRQLDIRADLSGAGESSGVTREADGVIGEADGEGGGARDTDGGPPEAPLHDVETDDIEEEADNETLSDIDDDEVKGYLHNDEEVRLKTIIWTEMNKEYLEEQEAKRAAIEASEKARIAAFEAAATNSASAADLAAAAAAAVAKLKKDRKQKRVDEANRPPAESAADAARHMLATKRLSSKVNYAVLANLFDADNTEKEKAEAAEENSNKRQRKVTFEDEIKEHIAAQVANGDAKEENVTQVEAEKVEEGDDEEVYDEQDEEVHDGAADDYYEDDYDEYE